MMQDQTQLAVDGKRGAGVFDVRVPSGKEEYTFGKSSKGKKVLIPKYIWIDNVKFVKLALFPNTQISSHAGAHGCVAAYRREGLEESSSAHLPGQIALKCIPHGPKRKAHNSAWMNEWKIHSFLRNSQAPVGVEKKDGNDNEEEDDDDDDVVVVVDKDEKDHPAFVNCLGGVVATVKRTTQVYFALEFMDTDLFTMIERSATMKNFGDWILKALYNTAKALSRLHSMGIIYCDLKPENVLVNLDGRAKFGDFDRSCIPGLDIGVVGGTKGYYSPERMRNSSLHTKADDVWALGVLCLIAATAAASPYLDYTCDNVHKFSPSRYLRRYARCNWSHDVLHKVCDLCEEILAVDAHNRAPLSKALSVLGELAGAFAPSTTSSIRTTSNIASISPSKPNNIPHHLTKVLASHNSSSSCSTNNFSSASQATTNSGAAIANSSSYGFQRPMYIPASPTKLEQKRPSALVIDKSGGPSLSVSCSSTSSAATAMLSPRLTASLSSSSSSQSPSPTPSFSFCGLPGPMYSQPQPPQQQSPAPSPQQPAVHPMQSFSISFVSQMVTGAGAIPLLSSSAINTVGVKRQRTIDEPTPLVEEPLMKRPIQFATCIIENPCV